MSDISRSVWELDDYDRIKNSFDNMSKLDRTDLFAIGLVSFVLYKEIKNESCIKLEDERWVENDLQGL